MQTVTPFQKTQASVQVNAFIRSVYNWMAIGLALTGFVAYAVATNGVLKQMIFGNRMVFFGLILAELGFVFYLSARIQKISAATATALFTFYAVLNGATLASIFFVYTQTSIYSTFLICAATFSACSVYGMVTKRDLTSLGGFMFMGLVGILIATVINIFVGSSAMAMIINYIGVFVFVGLTAYDTQKIKYMALSQPGDLDNRTMRKGAIIGALSLYLDFINMFIFMLQILGNRD